MPKHSRTDDLNGDRRSGARLMENKHGHGSDRKGGSRLRYKGTSTSTTSSSKRARTAAIPTLSLEGSHPEEVLLLVLHFLSAHDLVTVSRVSSSWHRLTQDDQLWRSLYLNTYASASTRRQALSGGAQTGRTRPWRELYKISTNWRSGSARTSTLGRGLRQAILPDAPPELELQASRAPPRTAQTAAASDDDVDTLLQFHQHFFFSASRTAVLDPALHPPPITVHQTLPVGDSAVVGSFSSAALATFFSSRPDFRPSVAITELRLDDATLPSSNTLLLAAFYSTGQFSLFRLNLPSPSSPSLPFSAREVYTSLALGAPLSYPLTSRSSTPFDPVLQARLYSTLLVTCSESLTVRFWRVDKREDGELEVTEAETPLQTSEKSWKPVVLSLAKVDDGEEGKRPDEEEEEGTREERFRATLAYSTPVWPLSWTVGLQEFLITVPPASSASLHPTRSRLSITARHAFATPVHNPLPTTPRRTTVFSFSAPAISLYATSPNPVAGIEHHHPFIVTCRRDNQLDVFEIVSPSLPAPPPPPPPSRSAFSSFTPSRIRLSLSTPRATPVAPLKLEHRRTLFGHTARVSSVALLEGSSARSTSNSRTSGASVRCVSAGDDGAVKVWELRPSGSDGGEGKGRGKKRRRGDDVEEVIDVQAASSTSSTSSTAGDGEGREGGGEAGAGETSWTRMKRRRTAGLHGREEAVPAVMMAGGGGGEGERPERVKRVMVGQDKIVLIGAGAGGRGRGGTEGGETVRVLRFD